MNKKKLGLSKLEKIIRRAKPELKNKFKVKRIGIFGSRVKGLSRKNSDLDVLVEFSSSVDILEFIALENYLIDQTGTKVDLVSRKALRPEFKKQVLSEVVYI